MNVVRLEEKFAGCFHYITSEKDAPTAEGKRKQTVLIALKVKHGENSFSTKEVPLGSKRRKVLGTDFQI